MKKIKMANVLPIVVIIGAIFFTGCASLGKEAKKPEDKIVNKTFNLGFLNSVPRDMRYVVVEKKNWDKNLNKRVHPHIVPVRTAPEGGPAQIKHRWIELTMLAPGTVLWNCRNEENNFVLCNVALKSLGAYGNNNMEVAALRSLVVGYTNEDDPVIRAYFYLSEMIKETRLDILSADLPYFTKADRRKIESKTAEKFMDRPSRYKGKKPVVSKHKHKVPPDESKIVDPKNYD